MCKADPRAASTRLTYVALLPFSWRWLYVKIPCKLLVAPGGFSQNTFSEMSVRLTLGEVLESSSGLGTATTWQLPPPPPPPAPPLPRLHSVSGVALALFLWFPQVLKIRKLHFAGVERKAQRDQIISPRSSF